MAASIIFHKNIPCDLSEFYFGIDGDYKILFFRNIFTQIDDNNFHNNAWIQTYLASNFEFFVDLNYSFYLKVWNTNRRIY